MNRLIKMGLAAVMTVSMAGCSLPRGVAVQKEILKEQQAENKTFAVEPVTRASVQYISNWPSTGWHGHYHWLGASKGPTSSVIEAGDKLNIVVWDNQPNSLLTSEAEKLVNMPEMTVSASGAIFMPYIGEIVVRGLTEDGARRRIQPKLEEIVSSAQVQISVKQGPQNSVDVVSGVRSPGTIPLQGRNVRILTAIAQSGGIESDLRNPLVRLQRSGSSYETRADRLLAEASRNVTLRGGDQVIVVEDDRYFTALGASQNEEIVYFEKEEMSAMDALAAIGGLSDSRADPKGVLVLREYKPSQTAAGIAGPDMTQVVFTIDLTTADGLFAARNFQVNPMDTVMVTESPVNNVRTVFGLVGQVFGLTNQVN